MNEKLNSVEAQRIRYDREAVSHEKHHAHELNQRYRDQFIRDQILDIDLAGKEVLDGMCASGIETGYLLSRQARVTGLDISGNNIALYQTKWGRPSHVASIHETGLADNTFDLVYIFGGLHHVIPLLDETMREMHRIVRPGGYLVFVEPNRDTFVNKFRELWYKTDKRFQAEERALSYPALAAQYLPYGFAADKVIYGGNVAYLLIAQSLILGIPGVVKTAIYRLLFAFERTVGSTGLAPKLFFAARWRKT